MTYVIVVLSMIFLRGEGDSDIYKKCEIKLS